jgi:hypothetical protein
MDMPKRTPFVEEKLPPTPDFSIIGALTEAIELLKLEAERLGGDETGLILDAADQNRRERAFVEARFKLELVRQAFSELGLK